MPRNNGRAGIMGGSPQAPVGDFWMGDDFFHNGAFRMSYGYEYVKLVETSKTLELVSFGDKDAYDLYLSANRRRYPSRVSVSVAQQ